MSLNIQDPSYDKSKYLHEALISACVGKKIGGGAYAFASKDGIELLLEDENFKEFLKNGSFLLIIGMDDITNIYSINTIKRLLERYEGHLKVKAYIHNSKGSIFHPKYSWFANDTEGVYVVGSGNLTQKGMRQNREVYTIVKCQKEEKDEVISEWKDWVEHSKPFLFDINEDIVKEYAIHNTHRMKTIIDFQKKIGKNAEVEYFIKYLEILNGQPKDKKYISSSNQKNTVKPEEENEVVIYDEGFDIDLSYWTIDLKKEVLIAEIPKSGTRWQQVNFDKKSFEEFFGATCGENGVYRILLRNMKRSGVLGDIEVRPSVSVSSQNYRFELDAAKGIDYPSGRERPLGIFVKVSPRDFLYELVMPEDKEYKDCISILDSKEPYSVNRMRRVRFLCQEIYERTSRLALWKRLDV